jgi:hypothetical protein
MHPRSKPMRTVTGSVSLSRQNVTLAVGVNQNSSSIISISSGLSGWLKNTYKPGKAAANGA